MSTKSRGISAERELLHMFWDRGWAAMRSPGSGSSSHPSPDIIAGTQTRKLAIECKLTTEKRKYIKNEEIDQLYEFSKIFGSESWLAIRFPRENWLFLNPEDLKCSEGHVSVNVEEAKNKGLLLDEVIDTQY